MVNAGLIAVYCGSSLGSRPEYAAAAAFAARRLVSRGYGIVYGGGSGGLMGVVADEALRLGGEVIGVIPTFIDWGEITHRGLTELRKVAGMHERKRVMSDLSSGALILPGGNGTGDEMFEYLTWSQLRHHQHGAVKQIGVFNVCGYYDFLEQHFNHGVAEGFVSPESRALIHFSSDLNQIVNAILP